MRFRLLILLALTGPLTAIANPLAPMSYLAGHCWKGDVPATLNSDEHCFQWILNRRAVRDTHVIRTDGKPVVTGETTYFWNPVSKSVEYIYLDSAGTYARGQMESAANMLYFPPTEQDALNRASAYRVRWNPLSDDSFQAFSEGLGKDGSWFTVFQMTLRRTK